MMVTHSGKDLLSVVVDWTNCVERSVESCAEQEIEGKESLVSIPLSSPHLFYTILSLFTYLLFCDIREKKLDRWTGTCDCWQECGSVHRQNYLPSLAFA